jgi:hypothetical protein
LGGDFRVGIRSLVKIPGKATYSKRDPDLFLRFFKFRFLFIAPDALDVISPIRMVGDGWCVVCLSLHPESRQSPRAASERQP